MSEETNSTRRSFLKGSAIIAAPLAVASAPAAAAALSGNDADERLARLEAEKAVRALHQTWLRQINNDERAAAAKHYADDKCACALAGIYSMAMNHVAPEEVIEISTDGRKATARFALTVETSTLIAPDNTLAQMLHAQGEGYVRTQEARILEADYVQSRNGQWAIARLEFVRS